MAPGSDVGNMSILGYDPAEFHTGRAPIEAASLGLKLPADRLAYRCNLVTVGDDTTMVDFAGGHPPTDAARAVLEDLDATLGRGNPDSVPEFHAGVEYRPHHGRPRRLARRLLRAAARPDQPALGRFHRPGGRTADRGHRGQPRVLARHPDVAANQIWLWGQGFQPSMPDFAAHHGITGGITTAVDLVRGLGVLDRHGPARRRGRHPGYDTDYTARVAPLAGLGDGLDLFVIHVEATDEAGHAGDVAEKVRSLELWDSQILAGLVPELDRTGPGDCRCCPITRPRWPAAPTPPIRCPTCWSTAPWTDRGAPTPRGGCGGHRWCPATSCSAG